MSQLQAKSTSEETSVEIGAAAIGPSRLDDLVQARRADAAWREARRAGLRRKIAAFPKLFSFGFWSIYIPVAYCWKQFELAVRADPSLFPFGLGRSEIAVAFTGVMLLGLLGGTWSCVICEWVKRRETELAGLSEHVSRQMEPAETPVNSDSPGHGSHRP